MISENKTKVDFITVFSTGMIGRQSRDFTEDAFKYAKIDHQTLEKWLISDPLFASIYNEIKSNQNAVRTLFEHMTYVTSLRKKLLNRPDIIDITYNEIK